MTNGKALRGKLIIYKDRGIETGVRTNSSAAPFAFTPSPGPGLGLIASFSLQAISPNEHMFLGSDFNVYRFDTISPTPIGFEVQREIQSTINTGALRNVVSGTFPSLTQYWLGIPVGDDTFPTVFYVYDWSTGVWNRQVYTIPTGITSMTTTTFANTGTIDTLTGTIASLTGTIDSLSGTRTQETMVMGFDTSLVRQMNEGTFAIPRAGVPQGTIRHTSFNTTSFVDVSGVWSGETGAMDGSNDNRAASGTNPGILVLNVTGLSSVELPSDAVISGIEVVVEGFGQGGAGNNQDLIVTLYNDTSTRTVVAGTSSITIRLPPSGSGNEAETTAGGPSNLWGASSIALSELTGFPEFTSAIFGIGIEKETTSVALSVDHYYVIFYYTTATTTSASIKSHIDTIDTDFGQPTRNKTFTKATIHYKDVSSSVATFQVKHSIDKGKTFTSTQNISTLGNGDGALRQVSADFLEPGVNHRIRVEHDERDIGVTITEVEMHAQLGGPSIG